MRRKQLTLAIEEAKRFIARAAEMQRAQDKHDLEWKRWAEQTKHNFTEPSKIEYHSCPREQGALRRSSLDLTRALAQLRKREP